MPPTFINIASTTLGSATDTVTFSSIPNTYTDLFLRLSVRGTSSSLATKIRFNGDASGNNTSYNLIDLISQGNNGVLNNRYFNNYEIDTTRTNQASTSWTANTFTSVDVYIPNYATSINKPFNILSSTPNMSATSVNIDNIAALWRNTATISTMAIVTSVGFAAGSSFYLYGIKNS